ncbi:hypothetical protein [Saccharothrix violaceirubra]|uniref:Uncharacterized protein n=1 Tax=Saccharothrix violaceirubra TaxID=413306 RepID=A0A7W7T8D2_9PSEU|nr:hypothetical protein [Saccharothrix violaceirubra]MBB4968473.1 hypothetical protein [Saccharothrix violaceirubra]
MIDRPGRSAGRWGSWSRMAVGTWRSSIFGSADARVPAVHLGRRAPDLHHHKARTPPSLPRTPPDTAW